MKNTRIGLILMASFSAVLAHAQVFVDNGKWSGAFTRTPALPTPATRPFEATDRQKFVYVPECGGAIAGLTSYNTTYGATLTREFQLSLQGFNCGGTNNFTALAYTTIISVPANNTGVVLELLEYGGSVYYPVGATATIQIRKIDANPEVALLATPASLTLNAGVTAPNRQFLANITGGPGLYEVTMAFPGTGTAPDGSSFNARFKLTVSPHN